MSEIRIITEPKIYLVGAQYELWHGDGGLGEFLGDIEAQDWSSDANHAAELLPEIAGRLCYMSYSSPRPGGNKGYLSHILEGGHGSVLEHAVFNFIFTGVSRSLTHELIRHRAGWGYSELSQRFVDSSNVAFVAPPALLDEIREGRHYLRCKGNDIQVAVMHALEEETPEATIIGLRWIVDNLQTLNSYARTCDYLERKFAHVPDRTARRKRARESARSGLPNCTETRIFATANVRAIRHFIEQRASLEADAEIRRLALALLRIMNREANNLFDDFSVATADDGTEYAACEHRKV